MKKFILLLTLVALCALALVSFSVQGQGPKNKLRKHPNKVTNSYIVVLEDWAVGYTGDQSAAPQVSSDLAAAYNGKLKHVYKHAISGFSVEMTEEQAAALSEDARVKYVEEDTEVHATT